MATRTSKKSQSVSLRPKPLTARRESLGVERRARKPESLVEKLRGKRSVGYMLVFLGVALVIQGFHVLEHIAQTLQVFVFGVPRPMAGGLLGSAVDFPWVHFVYNFVLFLALVWVAAWAYGLGGFRRFDRIGMWCLLIAAGIQTYHAGEHIIQISQEFAVGTQRPPGFIGFFQDNVVVHLTLNAVEWVLPFGAFWRFGGIEVMKNWILKREVIAPATAT